MAQFVNPSKNFPICDAVIYGGPGKRIMETVLTPIPDGSKTPVPGGAAEHMKEILKQLDEVLANLGADRTAVVSVKLFVQHVRRDIQAINEVYKAYFGSHTPMRCAVGAELQADMLVEMCVVAEVPA